MHVPDPRFSRAVNADLTPIAAVSRTRVEMYEPENTQAWISCEYHATMPVLQ
jgi:hypothetical protein